MRCAPSGERNNSAITSVMRSKQNIFFGAPWFNFAIMNSTVYVGCASSGIFVAAETVVIKIAKAVQAKPMN